MEGLEGGELFAFGGHGDLVTQRLKVEHEVDRRGLAGRDLDGLRLFGNDAVDVRDDLVDSRWDVLNRVGTVLCANCLLTQFDYEDGGAPEWLALFAQIDMALQPTRRLGGQGNSGAVAWQQNR